MFIVTLFHVLYLSHGKTLKRRTLELKLTKFNIKWFDELGSTNTYLKGSLCRNPKPQDRDVIVAGSQTSGRGRKQRSWVSWQGNNLTFSILIKTAVALEELSSITLVAGVAVAEYLKDKGIAAQLKWPNDIMVSGKKICGILAELSLTENSNSNYIILGIGLNVNMGQEEAAAIDKPATSMRIILGETLSLDEVLDGLLCELGKYIDLWQDSGFGSIRDKWQSNCIHIGKDIVVTNVKGDEFTATFDSLGANGELVVRKSDGNVEVITEADIGY